MMSLKDAFFSGVDGSKGYEEGNKDNSNLHKFLCQSLTSEPYTLGKVSNQHYFIFDCMSAIMK